MVFNNQKENQYENHFLMKLEDIKEYVVHQLNLFEKKDDLEVKEIGDGNINYVYKIIDNNSKKTVVIKQADKYLRSSGRLLSLDRNKIEAKILKIQYELSPKHIPEVYSFDNKMYALTMEDISNFKNMRYELINRIKFHNFSEEVSEFLTNVLLPTTDLVLDRATKKERVKVFTNIEMCDISEDLVFTEPYYDYKNQNIITFENQEFIKKVLYDNEALHTKVAWLRNNFMNNPQGLIHGDLHTGSIFINKSGIKVIDPEFAFYGPIGYDIGNVLAHLFFPLVLNLYNENYDSDFHIWITKSIEEVYNKTKEKLYIIYDNTVTFPLYKNNEFKKQYIDGVMKDSLGYVGTEIIRRVVGDSKVKELSLFDNNQDKVKAERLLINFAIKMITKNEVISNGTQILEIFNQIEEGV